MSEINKISTNWFPSKFSKSLTSIQFNIFPLNENISIQLHSEKCRSDNNVKSDTYFTEYFTGIFVWDFLPPPFPLPMVIIIVIIMEIDAQTTNKYSTYFVVLLANIQESWFRVDKLWHQNHNKPILHYTWLIIWFFWELYIESKYI